MEPTVACRESPWANTPATDALFLDDSNWRAIEVIEAMEADLGQPVFTANQVTMASTLRKLGVQPKAGYGSVFDYS